MSSGAGADSPAAVAPPQEAATAGLNGSGAAPGANGEVGAVPDLAFDHPDWRPSVLAAGVVCWRTGQSGLEVLLIHRPRYDDWSFPKGKLDPDEPLPECAIRELIEETGVIGILGRPLPAVRYLDPKGARKEVSYWACRPVRTVTPTAKNPDEVDRWVWVTVPTARTMITNPGDLAPLQAVVDMANTGELDTVPVLVVRHGTARPRDSWARADADRPLIASGRRQADALRTLLACWRPEHILSSSWKRCVDTITPFAKASGVKVRTKTGLTERGFRRSPGKIRSHMLQLVNRARPSVICTHRPVLPGVFRALREQTAREVVKLIPSEDPYLAPGEVLVAHVVHPPARPARVVAIERHLAPR